MASTRKLIVQVVGDARSLSKTMKQVAAESMTFGDKVAASTKRMAVPAAAALAGLSAAAASFARAAAEDQRSAALLAQQMRQTTGATQMQIAATEEFISRLSMAAGVADDELRPALAQLVRATGDVGKAQSLLKTALDVSAGSGRSLSSVVQALSRASQGQFTALKRLGIPLDENIIKTKDFDAAMQVLTATFGGQADVAANTAEGKMRRFGIAVGEAKEAIGAALLPALEAILPKLIGFSTWAQNNAGLIAGVGTVIAGLSAVILAGNAVLKAWAFASKIATLANYNLAGSNLAVQASTIIGIGAATAAAGTIAYLAGRMSSAAESATSLSDAMLGVGDATKYTIEMGQSASGGMMGPISWVSPLEQSLGKLKPTLDKSGNSANTAAQAFEQFKNKIKTVKDGVRAYVKSISDAITSTVSLSEAFSQSQQEQADITQVLTDALERRRNAYSDLNQAKQTGDTLAYAAALDEVAASEAAVASAQAAKPRDYTSIFRAQIEAAKNFAGNLKTLIGTGNLSKSALQQLLALGPVAGAQVAQDLLNGVSGFTAASLSGELAALEATATGVGMSMPGVSELLGARAGGSATNYYITVQAGVGDRNAIAKEVVDLLKVYNRSNGAIPVRVTG